MPARAASAREPRRPPVELNADEAARCLEAGLSLKTRAALTTAYAAGLPAYDAVGLKVVDMDSVRDGNAGRSRQGRQEPYRQAVGPAPEE
jgi:hypothetical protein